jgi:Catechol dioxygenase N terminus
LRNFNENTITDAVLERITGATDPRIREISEALVRHLHAFVREVRPTQKEWDYGIEFLTRTGHMCDDKRQEFILLSDTLGVSMLVDAINHSVPEGATETTVLGPFFVQAAPEKQPGDNISGGMAGDAMIVTGSVSSTAGRWPTPSSTSGTPTMTVITKCSSSTRSGTSRCARVSAPTRMATSISGQSSPLPTPSRTMARSERCWKRKAAIPGARRMYIS